MEGVNTAIPTVDMTNQNISVFIGNGQILWLCKTIGTLVGSIDKELTVQIVVEFDIAPIGTIEIKVQNEVSFHRNNIICKIDRYCCCPGLAICIGILNPAICNISHQGISFFQGKIKDFLFGYAGVCLQVSGFQFDTFQIPATYIIEGDIYEKGSNWSPPAGKA